MKRLWGVWGVAILCLSLFTGGVWSQEEPVLVTFVEVVGHKRIEEATIRGKIKTREGDPFLPDRIREDIRSLFLLGYFDDVQVDVAGFEGGVKVTYRVVEKPFIKEVLFDGNKKLDSDKLKERLTVLPFTVLNPALVSENAERLRVYYQEEGYYHAKVIPVIKSVTPHEAILIYQIEEGIKVTLATIRFEGNKAFTDRRLKKEMKMGEWWLLSFLTGSGVYQKAVLIEDLDRIRNHYYNHGYIQVQVAEPRIALDAEQKRMTVTIGVIEGEQFRIGEVQVKGNELLAEAEIRKAMKSKPGEVFSREHLRADVAAISERYSEIGRALVNVSPRVTPEIEAKKVEIVFEIAEGKEVRVGRIDISGNEKTRDKVIRREMRLNEGDTFRLQPLRRSADRLRALGFFESVEIAPAFKPEESLVNFDVRVKERPTGFLSVGGGYSSYDKLIGLFDIRQENLFGRGQFLNFQVQIGSKTKLYDISFREPYFLDYELLAGFDVFRRERIYDSYTRKSTGFDIVFGKPFWEYYRSRFTYLLDFSDIFNVADTASSLVKSQAGKSTTSSVAAELIRDSRNDFFNPTRGSRHVVYLQYAGLGGTNHFYKAVGDTGWYIPFAPVPDSAFLVRGRIGIAEGLGGEELPLFERFYVGGIATVRGLQFGDAGPRDIDGARIGGTRQLIFNVEYAFPLVREIRLNGVVFFDWGRAFGEGETLSFSALRKTAGFGVRWLSPVGPLRIEWGYNLKPEPGEDQSRIEFTVGAPL